MTATVCDLLPPKPPLVIATSSPDGPDGPELTAVIMGPVNAILGILTPPVPLPSHPDPTSRPKTHLSLPTLPG
jgi:hypothetical protein